jgi:acetolactate synthase-1/2/3 large subunit
MLSGRPGPVNIDVPFNVFRGGRRRGAAGLPKLGAEERRCAGGDRGRARPDLSAPSGAVRRPWRHARGGERRATAPPASSAFRWIPRRTGSAARHDGSASLGFTGRNGAYPANPAGRHADVVIAVGARFDDRSASSSPGYS